MGLVLRLFIAVVSLFFLMWMVAVGYMIADPVYHNVVDPVMLKDTLGIDPSGTVMFMMGFAFVIFIIGIFLWALLAPVRKDTRQEVRF